MDIIKYPDPILREKSQDVILPLSAEDREFLDNMLNSVGVSCEIISAYKMGHGRNSRWHAKQTIFTQTLLYNQFYSFADCINDFTTIGNISYENTDYRSYLNNNFTNTAIYDPEYIKRSTITGMFDDARGESSKIDRLHQFVQIRPIKFVMED